MYRRSFLFVATSAFSARAAGPSLGTIAYVQEDGLWTRNLPADTPHRVVEGANLASPRFSQSGKWLAYSQDDILHVVSRQDGKAMALGEAKQSQWLPRRDDLLMEDEAGLKLLTYAGGFRTATRQIPNASFPAIFGAGGNEMVYADFVAGGRGAGGEPIRTGRLCRLALDHPAASPKVLVSNGATWYIPGLWTGDGQQILYWEDPDFSASIMSDGLDLFRLPAAGGTAQRIGVASLVHQDSLTLSPDGDRLAIGAGSGRSHWSDKRIAILDMKGGQISYVTETGTDAVFPAWSPGGDRIAYSAAPNGDAGGGGPAKRLLAARRIWVGSRQLTNDSRYRDEKPLWSADGSHILFCRIDGGNNRTLCLTDVKNGPPIPVSGPLHANLGLSREDEVWFGYYGYIDWGAMMDWHRQ